MKVILSIYQAAHCQNTGLTWACRTLKYLKKRPRLQNKVNSVKAKIQLLSLISEQIEKYNKGRVVSAFILKKIRSKTKSKTKSKKLG